MDPRICIIGAGISGLSAGYQLMKSGMKPILFEKESFVGGRMSSEEIEGFIIDKGAYTIPEFHKTTLELISELSIAGSLKETIGTSSTFCNGKEYSIKIGSPVDFLKYKLLSIKNKKDMIKLFLHATSLGKSLNLNHPSEKTFELEKESAAEFLLKEYDKEILEYIAYPIFSEIFLGIPENNSKAAFLATVQNLIKFKIFSLDQGLGMLPEQLMKRLDVRLNTPVLKVQPMGEQGPYLVETGGNASGSLEFDIIVLAVPTPISLEIFENFPVSLKECLRQVYYTPSVVTVFGMNQRYQKTSFINNLLRKDFQVLGTIIFDHHKGSRHVPMGKGLVTAILSENGSRNFFNKSDDIIKQEALREIDLLFSDFSKKVIFSKVYRWEYGAIQLKPGILYQQGLTRKALEDRFRNLFFVSDSLNRSSIEVQIRAGIKVAMQIIQR